MGRARFVAFWAWHAECNAHESSRATEGHVSPAPCLNYPAVPASSPCAGPLFLFVRPAVLGFWSIHVIPDETELPSLAELDQRVTLRRIGWKDYVALLGMRDPEDAVRATYLGGELELTSLCPLHLSTARRLSSLVVAFATERGLDLMGPLTGSLKNQALGRGIEPDGGFLLGSPHPDRESVPDIALDVVVTPGGIPRLEVYRGLGVQEVWFWRDEQLKFYASRDQGFEQVERSELVPTFDSALVGRFMLGSHEVEAVQAFRQVVRVA
jgi:Uma2 family endonuclease